MRLWPGLRHPLRTGWLIAQDYRVAWSFWWRTGGKP